MEPSTYSTRDVPPQVDSQSEESHSYVRRRESPSGQSCYQDAQETSQGDGLDPPTTPSPSISYGGVQGWQESLSGKMAIPPCTSKEDVDALLTATALPPVTKESLEELDLMWIQSNINLRVDINYDHDLHFMPVSGRKGDQKRQEARKYWLSLEAELRIRYRHAVLVSCAECEEISSALSPHSIRPLFFGPRLPQMVFKLKELLIILVPDRDQDQIAQYLDVSLLLQEASHGLLDVVRLARWLCELLTSHCAPMRDESAQEMAEQVRVGTETGDLHALVAGVEKLFAFLEAMKLDVANHQIRSLRYQLIDDTVAFQKDYFRTRINNGKLDVKPCRQWYASAVAKHRDCQRSGETRKTASLGSLIHGLIDYCLSANLDVPATLHHDKTRLRTMRDELQDILHLNICLSIFDQLIRHLLGPERHSSAMHSTLQTRIIEMKLILQSRIMDLTDGNTGPNLTVPDIWLQHGSAIALELTRAAYHVYKRAEFSLPDAEVAKTTLHLMSEFESERHHGSRARALASELEQAAHEYASTFQGMSTLAISEAQKQWYQLRQQRQPWRNTPDLDDMARRLAHIAVIHWMVWADLVYSEHAVEHDTTFEHEHGAETDSIRFSGGRENTGISMNV
ncbi:uncharacterized protein Z518_01713 [Rhinocladiella mackenziei CBS 650.93]|uniref:cAMP-mediated signaling protein Sok1 n=1 Tax=Rhinocladiella mackenziei CBS 650.93 TaxID=1442369 RepID=A0A0D2IX90_9EURO|nr:uncharacterized protein Z518_01713 [Rhinocladiella mackenziei CBS 650.93]KIX10629.1 hypothetical protein Z518_01713 [Rhinocladiella mackenziei CBS 650.93]